MKFQQKTLKQPIVLLKDINELLTVNANQNVRFNLEGMTISNSTNANVIKNYGTLTIGTNDGIINTTSPILQSNYYGLSINSGKTVNYYDGIIRGSTSYDAIDYESRVTVDINNNVSINHGTEIVNGVNYKTAYLTTNKNKRHISFIFIFYIFQLFYLLN